MLTKVQLRLFFKKDDTLDFKCAICQKSNPHEYYSAKEKLATNSNPF